MSDKILPTRTTAIAVRPESIRTPLGKTEKRELRSVTSKTFLHADKAPDGKEIRTCQVQMGAVCYCDDNGELRSIDTTVRDLGDGVIGVEWAPYQFRLHGTGIGFDFTSREGGQVSIKLTGIGGETVDSEATLKPDITDNVITFSDVRPGCDIVFKCLNDRVKTLRILHDENAPKTFEWRFWSDKPELIDATLTGMDATGKALDLTATVDGDVIIETWAGGDVAYPVEIDPTVNASIAADADDGYETGGAWTGGETVHFLGEFSGTGYHTGLRFSGITIAQGSTISQADLSQYVSTTNGDGGTGTIYCRATDNAAVFDGSNRPSTVTKTTASVAVPASTATGTQTFNIAAPVQEVISRAGWVSGNALGVAIVATITSGYQIRRWESKENAGTNHATLSITYTAAAGGGTSPNLLLLGCG